MNYNSEKKTGDVYDALRDSNYIYPILNGKQRPKRDKAIALCLAVGMTDEECIRCLERSNLGILYAKNKRDSIIIYAFRNKMSVNELNAKLIDLGFNHLVVSKES